MSSEEADPYRMPGFWLPILIMEITEQRAMLRKINFDKTAFFLIGNLLS